MNTLAGCAKRSKRPISRCQREHFLNTTPGFVKVGVSHEYLSCCEQKKRRCIPAMQGEWLHGWNALKIRSNDWRLRCARAWKVVQVLAQVSNAPDTSEVPEKRWELRSTRVWSLSGCQSKSLAYPETINHFLMRQERFEGIDKPNFSGIKYIHRHTLLWCRYVTRNDISREASSKA